MATEMPRGGSYERFAMDMTSLMLGMVFGSIGMGIAIYGKKNGRPPALVGGGLLAVLPYVIPGALMMTVVCSVVLAGTAVASR